MSKNKIKLIKLRHEYGYVVLFKPTELVKFRLGCLFGEYEFDRKGDSAKFLATFDFEIVVDKSANDFESFAERFDVIGSCALDEFDEDGFFESYDILGALEDIVLVYDNGISEHITPASKDIITSIDNDGNLVIKPNIERRHVFE